MLDAYRNHNGTHVAKHTTARIVIAEVAAEQPDNTYWHDCERLDPGLCSEFRLLATFTECDLTSLTTFDSFSGV